jgi:cytochrome o ubiquinol oxidase subunit 3
MASIPHTHDAEAPAFYVTGDDDHGHAGSPTILGFWIYLMSDALIFAALIK